MVHVVTIDCRDTINCKVTIVLCNRAQMRKENLVSLTHTAV